MSSIDPVYCCACKQKLLKKLIGIYIELSTAIYLTASVWDPKPNNLLLIKLFIAKDDDIK